MGEKRYSKYEPKPAYPLHGNSENLENDFYFRIIKKYILYFAWDSHNYSLSLANSRQDTGQQQKRGQIWNQSLQQDPRNYCSIMKQFEERKICKHLERQ